MITPSLPAVCGLKYGVSGGSLYPSTSGSFLVSAEATAEVYGARLDSCPGFVGALEEFIRLPLEEDRRNKRSEFDWLVGVVRKIHQAVGRHPPSIASIVTPSFGLCTRDPAFRDVVSDSSPSKLLSPEVSTSAINCTSCWRRVSVRLNCAAGTASHAGNRFLRLPWSAWAQWARTFHMKRAATSSADATAMLSGISSFPSPSE